MKDSIGIVDIMVTRTAAIGKEFHYECEMMMPDTPAGRALMEVVDTALGGEPDIVSIDGLVIYCDNEMAVVKISSSFLEFEVYWFTYEQTVERFPDFEDEARNKRGDHYLWISLEDGSFVPNDPSIFEEGDELPEELEESILNFHETFKKGTVTISLPGDDIIGDGGQELYSGINRAVHWMSDSECAILTAWKDENTRSQNDSNNSNLQRSLVSKGFGVIKVKGVADWGKENSFITFNHNHDDAANFYKTVFELSSFYGQDCFLYKEPGLLSPAFLIGTNEAFGIGRKEIIGLMRINEMSPEAYSIIGSGTISFSKEDN